VWLHVEACSAAPLTDSRALLASMQRVVDFKLLPDEQAASSAAPTPPDAEEQQTPPPPSPSGGAAPPLHCSRPGPGP
jgi:hypothetical protein